MSLCLELLCQCGRIGPTREKDWDNLLTAHQNSSEARTWSTLKKALGEHHLCSRDESKITVFLSEGGELIGRVWLLVIAATTVF